MINQKSKIFAIGSPGGPNRKIFHFFQENKKVVKWCIGALRGPIWLFFRCFRKVEKSQKKISWNTDQVFRSVFLFFKRPKLCQNEVKSNSKKYEESPWFFLYSPVGKRGTLTVWSFEIRRGQTWPKPKINLGAKITNLNEILSFWSKIWDFDQTFAKKNSSKIPIWRDRYSRSVFHFFKRAKLHQNRVEPASKKYGWIRWFFLYKYSIGLRQVTLESLEKSDFENLRDLRFWSNFFANLNSKFLIFCKSTLE